MIVWKQFCNHQKFQVPKELTTNQLSSVERVHFRTLFLYTLSLRMALSRLKQLRVATRLNIYTTDKLKAKIHVYRNLYLSLSLNDHKRIENDSEETDRVS